ncbi:MAG: ABC transporter permease [Candidatus Sulfopaludibacter sp.]|nr:ABC transporter permease [Candidatus Sulfopaludibacter sp.]
MSALGQDLRYALRGLSRNRGFAAVAILTIGIGIGANTTVYSWIHALLLNPLPGASEPDRVVAVETVAANGDPLTTSYLDYCDFRDHLQSFQAIGAVQPATLAVGDETTQPVWGELVSGNYFDMMRARPEAGRFFAGAERDAVQNAHAVAVISYSFWKNRYNLSNSAVGATLRINRTPFTIIGVAPPRFHGSQSGLDFDLWLPVTMYGQLTHTGTWMLRDRQTRNFTMLARLKPGVTVAQARAETRALAGRMAVLDADTNQGIGADVLPMWKGHFTPQAVLLAPIAILMCASGLLLLIVCANVANMLLARAMGRQKEFSIRLALGAAPARLGQQLLTETLILALAGATTGLAVASWLGGSLRWLLPRVASPAILQPELDSGVLLFTTAVAFAVAILAGAGPAVTAARANVNDTLKEGGRSGAAGVHSHWLRGPLVVAEVALAVIALVGAGLFLKSFRQAREIRPGFDPGGVVLARFDIASAGYTAQQADTFCRRLREGLERAPGVTSVSYDDSPPLGFSGGNWEPIDVEGYVPGRNENMKIDRDLVSPGYFNLMKIPLLAGRDFDLGDTATKLHDDPAHRKVMIVNQEFARRFFAGRDPIGRKVRGWGEWFTVVGVAGNIKYRQLTEHPRPFLYVPIRQVYRPEYGLNFHVRTAGPLPDAITAIRREAAAIDPAIMIFDSMPLTEYISASLYGQKVGAILLNVLGGLGLLMAALGLYSVMAYSVAQRTAEIGIRMTLGAEPRDMMLMVLRQGLGFALIGLAVGSLAAAALARVAAAVLVSVSPADPLVYAGAGGFIVTIAVISAAIPAWRALRVDPIEALRCQ